MRSRLIRLAALAAPITLVACDGGRDSSRHGGDPRQDGGTSTTTGGRVDFATLHEHGVGSYAILLSDPSPPTYCWYIETTIQISRAGRQESARDLCTEPAVNCRANEPDDLVDENEDLRIHTAYRTVGDATLYGTCAHLDGYWADDPSVECLFHGHCYDGKKCVDYQCVCPPGIDCGCASTCGPRPSRCEGSTLIEVRPNGCDAHEQCTYGEIRTECGAIGCDESRGACGAPIGPSGGGQGDAGADPAPDAGTGAGADAGTPPDSGTGSEPPADAGQAPPECTRDEDCMLSGPTPPGVCSIPRCVAGMCTVETGPVPPGGC